MKKSNANLLFLAIGAAVGTAAAYITSPEKKKEWLRNMTNIAHKIKRNTKYYVAKGKEGFDDMIKNED